jgi:hypothetical protein
MRSLTIIACVACISLMMLGGCEKAPPPLPATHPVTGTVVYKGGGPVVGRIKFRPVNDAPFRAEAIIEKDGKFSLATGRVGSEDRVPGVPAGEYSVTVIPVGLAPNPTAGRPDIQLPDHVQVKEGDNTFTFEISRKR